MKIKRLLCAVLICTLIVPAAGCAPAKPQTQEYRFASYYHWFLGKDFYEDAMSFFTSGDEEGLYINEKFGENAREDGNYLIIEATDEQRDALIEQNRLLIAQAADELQPYGNRDSVKFAADWSTLTLTVDAIPFEDPVSGLDFSGNIFGIISMAMANRVLTSGDCDELLEVTVVNAESGHTLGKALFPYESLTITDKDLKASESTDVTWTSSWEGYSRLLATVEEVSEEKLIFRPLSDRIMYVDDELLCVCLDSVYAEDLRLPYGLTAGDEVWLTLDGLYAIHEDGDDIQDIAPLALIPAEYM